MVLGVAATGAGVVSAGVAGSDGLGAAGVESAATGVEAVGVDSSESRDALPPQLAIATAMATPISSLVQVSAPCIGRFVP